MSRPDTGTRAERIRQKLTAWYNYVYAGVWRDTRKNFKVTLTKVISLTVRSFMSSDLQSQACALTYRTLLAVVPAFALLVAIGRGFGFQSVLTDQLYRLLPSQHHAIEELMKFVDSYLSQASEGIFVGVGIVFLLWTLISLLSSVEESFNRIWRVNRGRSLWRKSTDYLAILLILPVIMICIAGITVTMSTALKYLLPFDFMKPALTFLVDAVGVVLTWLFFAGAFMLIPNAKVKFKNAIVPGILVGTAFQVLQWIFMSGQMYVAKYNAIYGSFSFLPLFLIWLQLVWLFTLTGALLCYASQNIGQFSYGDDISNISPRYSRIITIAVMTLIAKRFAKSKPPLTADHISNAYSLPPRLVAETALKLKEIGLVNFVESPGEPNQHPIQPAEDVSNLTVGMLIDRLQRHGADNFIPGFDKRYADVTGIADAVTQSMIDKGDSVRLIDIPVPVGDE